MYIECTIYMYNECTILLCKWDVQSFCTIAPYIQKVLCLAIPHPNTLCATMCPAIVQPGRTVRLWDWVVLSQCTLNVTKNVEKPKPVSSGPNR